MRQGYDSGAYFGTPAFINSLKYLASLISAVISYLYKLGFDDMLAIWIVTSVISTIFSYVWDLKVDWDLLKDNNKNRFLRKYITF
jgi:hypothetical protein